MVGVKEITIAIPHGGPLKMAREVAEVFLSHLECCCADDEKTSLAAAKKRDDLWKGLDARQRGYVLLVCSSVGRLERLR